MRNGTNWWRVVRPIALVVVIATTVSPAAHAEEKTAEVDGWKVNFVLPYLWFVGLNGSMTLNSRTADIDASFGDIVSNSDSIFAFAGVLRVRKGRWGGYVDGMYTKSGTDNSNVGPFTVNTTSEIGLFEFGGFYRAIQGQWAGRRWTLDALAAGRRTSLDGKLEFTTGPNAGTTQVQGQSWIDPIIGARAVTDLTRSGRWDFRFKGDFGGFGVGSHFTWNLMGTVGVNWEWLKTDWALLAGYRALSWDYEGANEFKWDMTQHGPIVGLSFGW